MARKRTPKQVGPSTPTDEQQTPAAAAESGDVAGISQDQAPADGETLEGETPTRVDPRSLPQVDTRFSAQDMQPRCDCPLTPGCRGKIHVYSSGRRNQKNADGQVVATVTLQYLKCTQCNRTPVNPRRIVQPSLGGRLFDRQKPQR
jgi:hypothetical protein